MGIAVEVTDRRSYLQNMSAAVDLLKNTLARSAAVSGGTAQDHHAEAFLDDETMAYGWQCLTPECRGFAVGFGSLSKAESMADRHVKDAREAVAAPVAAEDDAQTEDER